MDRLISLLAALVGLIALGGAILVHVNGDAQRAELAAEIAGLRTSMGAPPVSAAVASPAIVPGSATSSAAIKVESSSAAEPPLAAAPAISGEPSSEAMPPAIKALQDRIAELEQQNTMQASALAEAQAKLAAEASAAPSQFLVAGADALAPTAAAPSAAGVSSSGPPAAVADGPTSDCIPLGTRFMGKSGDSFPICKTKAVVKVAAVDDGSATIQGAGPIAAGGFGNLSTQGCQVMVFSADSSGYAEMRVTCQ
jgi:hypothetical protein